jgi:hypothetical protein
MINTCFYFEDKQESYSGGLMTLYGHICDVAEAGKDGIQNFFCDELLQLFSTK